MTMLHKGVKLSPIESHAAKMYATETGNRESMSMDESIKNPIKQLKQSKYTVVSLINKPK